MTELTTFKDPIVEAVMDKFRIRSIQGMQKYRTTMADNPKPLSEWIEDTQEELMDAILYLERMKHGASE
tara:strand:+ start:826 stop:1032 length:207 start_codon:yes stop_codon:yes gene_type:complete